MPPRAEHSPGDWITPDLQLLRLLGKGGMGTVWLGYDRAAERQVAVKLLSAAPPGVARERAARLKREAWAAAQIPSPHVVRIFGVGLSQDATPYIEMEALRGRTLAQALAAGGTLGLADTTVLLGQLADALGRAHALGIVHRDIKPDNVFLEDGHGALFAKILDFGVAKAVAAPVDGDLSLITATGVMVGTPSFMSPEQVLNSKAIDHRSDLWALGVLAYRALTGRLPFDHPSPQALCLAVIRGKYAPATTLRAELPAAIDGWFARAFAPKPEQRFSSAAQMAAALDAIAVEDEPTAARPGA